MVPAQQSFKAGNAFTGRMDHRLIIKVQPTCSQGIAQVVLKLAALLGINMQVWSVKVMAPPSAIFGSIQGKVCVAHNRFGSHAIVRRKRNANRCADDDLMFLNRIRFGQGRYDPLGKAGQVIAVMVTRQNDLELVAPQSPDPAGLIDRTLQAPGDLCQQNVANRMTNGVVDLLEAIKIQQNTAQVRPSAAGAFRIFSKAIAIWTRLARPVNASK